MVPLRLLLVSLLSMAISAQPVSISVINFSPGAPIKLYWYNAKTEEEMLVDTIEPYQEAQQDTHVDHTFVYYLQGEREVLTISADTQVYVIGVDSADHDDDSSIPVECSTTEGNLRITVKPQWSPRGAARFLDLVSINFFKGCALNRVVKKFLTQFGISQNYDFRTNYRSATIQDDVPISNLAFQPGFMAYAGSGPNSRTTEMFVVMPGTTEHQLQHFGDNPWETPFGYVHPGDVTAVVAEWYSYGDMPPWGKGPNPQLIYKEDGYDEYLANDFPEMSYIHDCKILDVDVEEEEL